MSIHVELSDEALHDAVAAAEWYELHRQGWGHVFSVAVEATLNRISRSPDSAPLVDPPIRRALVKRFPYGVFYLIDGDRIIVIAITHSSRNPNTWRKRIQGA